MGSVELGGDGGVCEEVGMVAQGIGGVVRFNGDLEEEKRGENFGLGELYTECRYCKPKYMTYYGFKTVVTDRE